VPHSWASPNATVSKGGQPFLDPDNPTIGQVTDEYLKDQYNSWNTFSQQALEDMKKIAQDQPGAWTPANTPRPSGAPLK
jgi:hypothetical protein